MDRIFFENIRCFRERQEARLAPLTLLVGENSTGKSTFLALVRLAWSLIERGTTPDFNEEPFLLGASEQIVRRNGRRGDDGFSLGLVYRAARVEARARFQDKQGQPDLVHWAATIGKEEYIKLFGALIPPVACAPIRSRPKRTYDPIRETRTPEGDHVPMLLARIARSRDEWEVLAK